MIFGIVTGGTVNACDLDTLACTEVATGIPEHTAITFDKHGNLWGSQFALTPGGAEVVQLPERACPVSRHPGQRPFNGSVDLRHSVVPHN